MASRRILPHSARPWRVVFPLSVIAGRYEIMKLIEDATVLHGGSFNGNPTVLAASEATLEELAPGRWGRPEGR